MLYLETAHRFDAERLGNAACQQERHYRKQCFHDELRSKNVEFDCSPRLRARLARLTVHYLHVACENIAKLDELLIIIDSMASTSSEAAHAAPCGTGSAASGIPFA
jgi:hypothetical protein